METRSIWISKKDMEQLNDAGQVVLEKFEYFECDECCYGEKIEIQLIID